MHSQYLGMRALVLTAMIALLGASEPLRVSTSDALLADLVRNIGGDRVLVSTLIPKGSDSHSFEPGPRTLTALSGSRLLVIHRRGSEPWVDRVLSGIGTAPRLVETATSIIDPLPDSHNGIDHHAWHDALGAGRMAACIAEALCQEDPAAADHYRRLNEAFQAQVRVLDAWIRREIATIPETHRLLITPHRSLTYFARAYGLEIQALVGCGAHEEPDPRAVIALTRLLADRRIPAVFTDGGVHDRLVIAMAGQSGSRIAGPLVVDGLGSPDQASGHYLGMMTANTAQIVAALRPSTPTP